MIVFWEHPAAAYGPRQAAGCCVRASPSPSRPQPGPLRSVRRCCSGASFAATSYPFVTAGHANSPLRAPTLLSECHPTSHQKFQFRAAAFAPASALSLALCRLATLQLPGRHAPNLKKWSLPPDVVFSDSFPRALPRNGFQKETCCCHGVFCGWFVVGSFVSCSSFCWPWRCRRPRSDGLLLAALHSYFYLLR